MSKEPQWRRMREAGLGEDTPFYLFDRKALVRALVTTEAALGRWGRYVLSYSVKTNPLRALLGTVASRGHAAEVVSGGEFALARAAGFPPDRIVFNGPLKAKSVSPDWLGSMVINVDSLDEIPILERSAALAGRTVPIGLRVCPPSSAPTWSRFGLSVEAGEFEEAASAVRASGHLRLAGLHMHLGTQVEDVSMYRRSTGLLLELWETLGLTEGGFLDIGGGFAFSHVHGCDEGSVREAVEAVASVWRGRRPILIAEPGRVIAGPALNLVSRVISTKMRPREPLIVVLDSGTNHNITAGFFQHDTEYERASPPAISQRLVGPLCMEDDILSGAFDAPSPAIGSLCMMRHAGAYSLAFARSFIQDVPPVFEIHGAKVRTLRKPQRLFDTHQDCEG